MYEAVESVNRAMRRPDDIATGFERLGDFDESNLLSLKSMQLIGRIFLSTEKMLANYTTRDYPLASLQQLSPLLLACIRAQISLQREKYLETLEEKVIPPESLNRIINI